MVSQASLKFIWKGFLVMVFLTFLLTMVGSIINNIQTIGYGVSPSQKDVLTIVFMVFIIAIILYFIIVW